MTALSSFIDAGRQYQQAGDLRGAEEAFRQALRADPDQTEAWHRLGQVCQGLGKLPDAMACYREALRLEPNRVATHNSLGNAQVQQRDLPGAEASYRRALQSSPDFAYAHNNLGNALKEQGKSEEALACYRETVRLQPDFADGHNNLGLLLSDLERFDEAVDSFRRVTQFQPDVAANHNRLGIAQARQKERAGAAESFRRAIELRPDFAQAHNNLGNVLKEQGDLQAALACYRRTVRLDPDFADAHNNLGLLLADLGQPEGALACYARALELRPDFRLARRNRSLTWLLLGDLAQGWPEYEQRWGSPELPQRNLGRPLWDGSHLAGQTVLLHAEQGLGDTLQFVRYAPLIRARGGRAVLVCQAPLLRLLAGCSVAHRLIAQGDPVPPTDVHAPLLSLPRIFGTTADSIPAQVPYLRADPALVECWRERLAAVPGFKVGIAWQGSANYRADCSRSVALARFAPLARVPGVTLLSLQKGAGVEQMRHAAFPVLELPGLDEEHGAFMDSAAVMACLDLVVTTDTALPHLAGALGVPCWLALPAVPDWRWLLGRDDSPWYPSLRLFRQPRPDDWDSVFQRLAATLRTKVGAPAEPACVAVEVAPGELLDKITILEIKAERITDAEKLRNVRAELATLQAARARTLSSSAELPEFAAELRRVNESLWDVEDALRRCERAGDFGPHFVDLARSVYHHNDRRADLKRRVNELFGSAFREEKQYPSYASGGAGGSP